MFEDKSEAREFAFDVADALSDGVDDGFLVRPSLDGVDVYLDDVASGRGTLDGQGYRVREGTIEDESEAGDWGSKLVVIGR